MPYRISPFAGWEVDLSGAVPKRPCCRYLNQHCNHIVFRSPSYREMPLAPFAFDWELDTESNIWHIDPFTGRLFGEGVRGEYLTTERFDEGLDQLLLAEIVCPVNSYMGLLSARKFFEEQEQPQGVIFFPKPEDMRPYVNSDGERAMQVVFLPPRPIEPEELGLWYTDELEESYWDLHSPNFLWTGGPSEPIE